MNIFHAFIHALKVLTLDDCDFLRIARLLLDALRAKLNWFSGRSVGGVGSRS